MRRAGLWMFVFFMMTDCLLEAQDIHFSQLRNAPLYLNPADAGLFGGKYRFVANHRSQWNSFTNAYSTFAFSADGAFPVPFSKYLNTGAGLLISSDLAGDGHFGTVAVQIPLAAGYTFDRLETSVRVGVTAGIQQYRLDINRLTFQNQFDGSRYNPFMTSGETGISNGLAFADVGAGLRLLYHPGHVSVAEAGLAVLHINEPDVSFSGDQITPLPARMTAFLRFSPDLPGRLRISPEICFSSQGTHSEWLTGVYFVYWPGQIFLHTINTGLYYRGKDALILMAGISFLDYRVMLSYDLNLSKLTPASGGRGGPEVSFIYLFVPHDIRKYKLTRSCPVLN